MTSRGTNRIVRSAGISFQHTAFKKLDSLSNGIIEVVGLRLAERGRLATLGDATYHAAETWFVDLLGDEVMAGLQIPCPKCGKSLNIRPDLCTFSIPQTVVHHLAPDH